jgi:hypothetical protein
VHDCFHTHWRWGKQTTEAGNRTITPPNLGWGPEGPNSQPDAPQVPPNQSVEIEVRGANMVYHAKCHGVNPGEWQVSYHHGAGYVSDLKPAVLGTFTTINDSQLRSMFAGSAGTAAGNWKAVKTTGDDLTDAAKPALFSTSELLYPVTKDAVAGFNYKMMELEFGSWAMLYWHLQWTIDDDRRVLPRLESTGSWR